MLAAMLLLAAGTSTAFADSPQDKVRDPVPLLELIAPGGAGRLYTLSQGEASAAARSYGFTLQPVRTGYIRARAFTGSQPLYRLRRNGKSSYLITASASERDALAKPGGGFTYEGVLGYAASAPGPGTALLWRYSNGSEWRIVLDANKAALEQQGYHRDGPLGFVYPRWIRAGALYFGMWNRDARNVIDATKRVYGRSNDWWGGVRDYSGQDASVATRRWLWPNDNFSELKPAIGWYDDSQTATVEKHIAQAAGAGLRFFSFYWYWDGTALKERYPNGGLRSFLRARNRDRLDFAISICSHPWENGRLSVPAAQFGTVADRLVRDYLSQPNYLRANDGRPLLELCDTRGIGSGSTADVLAFVNAVRAAARGIMGEEILVLVHRDLGLDPASIGVEGPYCGARVDGMGGSYQRYVATQSAYFASAPPTFMRCLMSDFDERPRYPHMVPDANAIRWFPDQTPALFSQATAGVREDIAASTRPPVVDNLVQIYAFNEWHEGGVIEPNATTGCRYLDIVRRELGLVSGDGCVANPPSLDPPSAPAPAPGGSPTATNDTRAPQLAVRVASRQRALRSGALIARVRCSEGCRLRARASVRVKRNPQSRAVKASARSGRTVKLRLKLTRPTRQRIRTALHRKPAVRAVLRIRATDAAGNAGTKRIVVRIVG